MFRINSEADRLLKSLFQYAGKRREEGVYDMTEILDGFYRERLMAEEASNGNKNGLSKRFRRLVNEYVETDPRYQSKIDKFA